MENSDDRNTRLVRNPMLLHTNNEDEIEHLDDDDENGRLVREPMLLHNNHNDDDGVIVEATPIIINFDENDTYKKEPEMQDADVCYKLISDDELMNTFFRKKIDWDQEDIDFYIEGVTALVDKFQKKGFQFSDDQILRIKKITGLNIINRNDLGEEELQNALEFKKYIEIYTDDNLYEQYLKTKNLDATINGVSKREINKYMLKKMYQYGINFLTVSEKYKDRYWRFKVVQDGYYKTYLNDDLFIDPELEKKIMANIPKNLSDELMAYNLYIELNKAVSLDSRFYITHQDNTDDYNAKLLSQDINEANPNNLICKIWSDMYYYLIKKYTNIDCFISMKSRNGDGHRYVMLLMDNGETIAVDGTNVVHDNMLNTNFTDILRCKLGLPTVNFSLYQDYHIQKTEFDNKEDPKEIIKKMLNIIGSKEELKSLNNLLAHDTLDTKNKLLLFINFIENRKNLDSISMRSLLSNLVYLFFNEEENVDLLDFYKELDDGQYEYINCIRNINPETKEKIYLLFDKNLGFIETTYDELKNMLSSGSIKNMPSRKW